MKTLSTSLFLSLFCFLSNAQKISPGTLWLDNNGTHINAHGGGIFYQKGVYYWFGEYRGDAIGAKLRVAVSCYSSSDLVCWKNEGVALKMMPDRSFSDIEKGAVIERLKVIYNKKFKQYVMWFHVELKWLSATDRYVAARAGVAVSTNITGPYKFISSSRINPSC